MDSVKKFPLTQDKIYNNTIYTHNIAIITKHEIKLHKYKINYTNGFQKQNNISTIAVISARNSGPAQIASQPANLLSTFPLRFHNTPKHIPDFRLHNKMQITK